MSRHSKREQRIDCGVVEVKSKFDAEFRRFSLSKSTTMTYEEFSGLLEKTHRLHDVPFLISYTDPRDGDLLPINNDDNLNRALLSAKPLLRVIIQRKGESLEELNGYGTMNKHRNIISTILGAPHKSKALAISNPHDFRQVSSIIDVDIVPETCRRVRLVKHGTERPLGFYIRDGTSFRVTPAGVQKVPGIFISRLVPGGLAESTGLLAVNDEVLEVNGIEVAGKSLDQEVCNMVAKATGSDGRGSPVRRAVPKDCYEPWEMTDRERELCTKFVKLIQGRIPSKEPPKLSDVSPAEDAVDMSASVCSSITSPSSATDLVSPERLNRPILPEQMSFLANSGRMDQSTPTPSDQTLILYVPEVEEIRISPVIARKGYLNILEQKTNGWKKRWVAVRRPYVFIFRDERDPVERALINLTTAQVEYSEDQQAMVRVPNSFSVVTKHRGYLMQTLGDKEVHDWLYAINPLLAGQIRSKLARTAPLNISPAISGSTTPAK